MNYWSEHAFGSKIGNLSFQKISFPRMKPILSSTYMRLTLHTAIESKIRHFFVLTNSWKSLKMRCNLTSKWIMRSPKKQAWCRGVSKWECKNTYKTCDILDICSKCKENYVFRIQWFSTKMSKSLFGSPRAPVERPETPPRATTTTNTTTIYQYHYHRMTSQWQQYMKNQWELTHFARLMLNYLQNHAKPKI